MYTKVLPNVNSGTMIGNTVQTGSETEQWQHHRIDSPDSISALPQEVPVTFFPPLNDSRRAWILKKLREERVTSVLDVGCGAGTLLGCLCNPPAFFNTEKNQEIEENSGTHTTEENDPLPDLRISRIAGLDISPRALEKCINSTAPLTEFDFQNTPRWERLEAKIWLGSLDVYNPEFVDSECIVSSEVIEHLPPDVLPAFATMLLGSYRARLLLITTPNYAFNARFSAPGTVDPAGFLDPTKRTTRVFRHHDHKFEWTPSEFMEWCVDAASTWGYTVEVDGVGLSIEPDPWGRDEEVGRASQVALFRRIDDWSGHRPTLSATPIQEQAHKLLKTHVHLPHPRAGLPESPDTIVDLINKYMESYYFDDGYSVWDLWVDNVISIACGGRLDVLLSAIEASPALTLTLTRTEGGPVKEWNVKFTGGKHQEAVKRTKDTQFWERRSPKTNQNYQVEEHSETEGSNQTVSWTDMTYEWYQLGKKEYTGGDEVTWASVDAWSEGWGQPVNT